MIRLWQDCSLATNRLTQLNVETLVLLANIHEFICTSLVKGVDGFERVSVEIEFVVKSDLKAGVGGKEVTLGCAGVEVFIDDVGCGEGGD